jgi:dihydrofolate reductase
VVVSTTLDSADWGPTTVISGDVSAVLAGLKEQPGKDIAVGASGTLVRFLLRERLLDELRLLVHPVIAGTGTRLFEGYGESLPLTLARCRAHGNGVVALHYTPGS